MKKTLTLLVAVVMTATALCGLVACNGKTSKADQNLTICVGSDPDTMDPALNSAVDGSIYLTNLFSGLYGYDKNLNIVADCAKEVVKPTALTGADEGKYQYVITLKDGLKWSDGTAMKASDFTYAWQRAADPATAADYQYIFDVIDGYAEDDTCDLNVTADDAAGTVTIVTAAYCSYFDQLLAFPTYFPVKQDLVKSNANWATSADTYVSNGAFKMKSWTVGKEIVFEKNENYWDAKNVKLDTITAFLSDDDDAIFANYTNGTIHYTTNVPVAQIPVLKADATRMNKDFFIGDYIGTYYLELNVEYSFKPGLAAADSSAAAWEGWDAAKNAEVRKALALLIDRNYIVKEVTAGGQLPAYGFIPAGMSDGNGHEFRKEADEWWSVEEAEYANNCAQAVEILKKYYNYDEATKKFTNFPKFEYSANPTSGNLAICAAIKDMWDDYGIEVNVDQRTWATIQKALTAGDFTLSRLGWIADYNDPVNFLEIYVAASGNNHPRLGKAASKDGAVSMGTQSVYGATGDKSWTEYDALIANIKTEADNAARANLMYEAEEWIRDTYTILPLYYYTNPYLSNPDLKDYIYSPLGWVSYKYAYMA